MKLSLSSILKQLKKIYKLGVDMSKKDVYIHYSGATDITGKRLQEALGIDGGKEIPTDAKMIIGWGAKIKEDITLPNNTTVLNHPNAIRVNRNKFEAMNVMAQALNKNGKKVIATYITTDQVKAYLNDGSITFPLIGRTKYHQGGKGFWTCPTMAQLDDAIGEGAHHFSEMIAIKDEYRLHVFDEAVIHAQKKVKRTTKDFEKSFVEDELERQKTLAKKNGNKFDEATAELILRRQAKNATAGGANMMLRSNKMGWKFSIVKKKIDKNMFNVAINAVKALGLTFGAVDCCVDVNGNAFIFEVNTGPGLEATSFEKYVSAFKIVIDSKLTKKAKTAGVTTTKNSDDVATKKALMTQQLSELQTMIEEVDSDSDLDTIKKLGTRLIFGGK